MKKFLFVVSLIITLFSLTSCQSIEPPLSDFLDAIDIGFIEGDSVDHVTGKLILPVRSTLNRDIVITWTSSNPNLVDSYGNIIRQDDLSSVTLTATFTYHGELQEKSFELTIIGLYTFYDVFIHRGDDVETLRLKKDTFLDEPTHTPVEGYYFLGWYIDLDKQTPYDFQEPLTADLNLYTKYEQILYGTYQLRIFQENLQDDDYTLISSNSYTLPHGQFELAYDQVFGFHVNLDESTLSGVISNQTLVLSVKYDRDVYRVKFISEDVTLYDAFHKFGYLIDPITTPVKEGYEFIGWSREETIQVDYNFDAILISNLTLYARFKFIDDVTYEGYYSGADGLAGTPLRSFLYQRVNQGFSRVNYDMARIALQESDEDPNNIDNIILVYLGTSVRSTWDSGGTWNREHVWPQSLLGTGTSTGPGTDLHNLKPANPSMNTSRGNKFFDIATTSTTFLPRPEVRGDVARILFYMDIAYSHLTLVSSVPEVYEMGKLDVLLRWHLEDPVDDFESNRNQVISTYQNNRNPFIDHPEFVEKIWGPITLSNGDRLEIKFFEQFNQIEIVMYVTDLSVFKKEQKWQA